MSGDLLRELNRVKIEFQLRTLTLVLGLRDSDGPRMAETNEDLARGEAGPARASEGGIAQ